MRLSSIAVANLRVRRARTAFLALGIVVAVTAVAGLTTLNAIMEEQLRQEITRTGSRLLVSPRAEELSLSYNGVAVASRVASSQAYLPEDALDVLAAVPGEAVAVVAPKVAGLVQVQAGAGQSRGVIAVGVDFAAEMALKPWYSLTGEPPRSGRVVLGSQVAADLSLAPGDRIGLNGREFTVAGSLAETGEADDRLIFLNLPEAQELFGVGRRLSFVELLVRSAAGEKGGGNTLAVLGGTAGVGQGPPSAAEIRPASAVTGLAGLVVYLQSRLPGIEVAPVRGKNQARDGLLASFTSFAGLVEIATVLTAVLIVLTTMMASVNERRREIGVFRALGFRRGHVLRVILTEAAVVSLAGGLAGYWLGLAAAYLARPYLAPVAAWRWDPGLPLLSLALALAVGLGAAFYPAWLAARLDPCEALRSI